MEGNQSLCYDPIEKRPGCSGEGSTQLGPAGRLYRFAARGARMFKSKPIAWITALTLLAVAGVALACRLKDGSGPGAQGRALVPADAAGPPPAPAEPPAAPPVDKKKEEKPAPAPDPKPPSDAAEVTPPPVSEMAKSAPPATPVEATPSAPAADLPPPPPPTTPTPVLSSVTPP